MNQLELEKRWCIRLLRDWQDNNKRRSLGLPTPTVTLISGKKYGHWDPEAKELGINRDLIKNHDFTVVLEVVYHEQAHAYVTEILKDKTAPPHGEVFQKACDVVGVHPDFRARSGRLPKFLRSETEEGTKTSSLQKKVEKLMALAESAQEHEAESAMNKANALIAKYNLEIISKKTDQEQEYDCIQFRLGKSRIDRWRKTVVSIIRDFYFVQSIFITQYDAKTDSTYKAVEFLGTTENLKIAAHAYNFINERLPFFWSQYKKKTEASQKEKNNYYLGLLYGFIEKLSAADKARNSEVLSRSNKPTTSALVLAEDTSLKKFFTNRYPNTKKTRGRRVMVDANAYDAGQQEGTRLTIHKAVHKNSGNQGRLLT